MKKIVIIAGMMAMAGALFLASPVSADNHVPVVTSTLKADGSATLTGTGFLASSGLYWVVCRGADVTSDEPINQGNAMTVCPNVIADSTSQGFESDAEGSFTVEISREKMGTVPEEGVVVIIGCQPLGCQDPENTGFTVVKASAEEATDEDTDEEATDTEEEPAAAEATDEGAGGDDDMSGDDSMDDASGGDDTASTTMADDMDSTEESFGLESGLLAVIAASVVIAGLFAVGIGRRISRRS